VTSKTFSTNPATRSVLKQERPLAKIYVSSTYSDLHEYREQVYRALRQLGHDVVAMEDYVAADQRPLERCLADVASSDLYVAIVGYRYGYVPEHDNPDGRSITELEYRRAEVLGHPRLIFLLDPAAPWAPQFMDSFTGEGNHGTSIRAFREELARNRLVSFFSTTHELAQKVSVAVTNLLVSGGTAPSQSVSEEAGGIRLVVAYAGADERLVHQLVDYLTSLKRAGLVSVLSEHLIDGTQIGLKRERADIVLLILTTDLVSGGYLESEELQWLLEQHATRQGQLLPVLLRPVAWSSLPPVLRAIPPLPGFDRSVTEATSREAALIEVVDGVRLACSEIVARRQRSPLQPPRPVQGPYKLVDVFKESGAPSVTFVEPDNFYQLKLDLEQPGRGVVIEGPSGVGKTTALLRAIGELDTEIGNEYKILSARDPEDVGTIAHLRRWHHGLVAIDDFHRLNPALRMDLVNYLKVLADTEPVDRKLVIVGIPGTKKKIIHVGFDIATRIGILSLGTVPDGKVLQMIEKGETALNIELVGKSQIVRAAAGSLNVAQIICRHVVALAGIKETQTTHTPVDSDLPRAMQTAVDMMALKFSSLVQSFAALDGPSERFCIELLMELAATKDGTLSLRQLGERRPELGPNIDRFVGEQPTDNLRAHHPDHDQHLLYDPEAATLVIDDPQFAFYLRQLNLEQLAVAVGKLSLFKRTRVFVSYSHKDAEWLERLRVHLKPLEREGLIDLWDDTRISAGSLWRDQIDAALESARVAVLLISADFLASDFITDNELPPLLDAAERDGCTVLPLLVQPSLFDRTPELSRFQTVNPNATPLANLKTSEREAVFVTLAKEIGALVKRQGA
jgi:hypothetical protein